MYLSKIELTNYRPYYETQSINLGYDFNKNVNVIYAKNAIGKSSLLNAITWAFYGHECHDRKVKKNPIYNKLKKNECKVGNSFDVKVHLEFFDFDEEGNLLHFHVTRTRKHTKETDELIVPEEDELEILDYDNETYHDQGKIYSRISRLMHKYFFFNGEQLNDYFDKKDLEDTIKRISQLNIIHEANRHLKSVRSDYRGEIKPLIKDTAPIIDKLEELTGKIQKDKEEKDKISLQVENLRKQIKRYDEKLSSLEKAKKLVNERKEKREDRIQINNELKEIQRDYNKCVIDLYCIVQLFDVLYEVASIDLGKTSNSGSDLDDETLRKVYTYILDNDICICGADLNKNPKHKNDIKKKLEDLDDIDDNFDDSQDYSKEIGKIKKLLISIETKKGEANNLRSSLSLKRDKISEIDNRLEEISHLLTNEEFDDINDIEENRIKTVNKCKEISSKLESLIGEIKVNENKETSLNEKLDKMLANKKEAKNLQIQKKFCETAIDIVKNLDENLKEDILEQVIALINKQFASNDFSDNKFDDVMIDKDYNVILHDFLDDEIAPGDLSGGEERILALSFIIALNSISGFDLPLFIDAPFSTLDSDNKIKFMDNLPKFTENKQVIFLFIDDNYKALEKELIKPYLNKEVQLIKVSNYLTGVVQDE